MSEAIAAEQAHLSPDDPVVRPSQIPVVLLHGGVVDPAVATLAERLEQERVPVQIEQVRDAFDMGASLGRHPAAVFFLFCPEDIESVLPGDIVAAFSALAWDCQVLRSGVRGQDLAALVAAGQAEVAEILRQALARPPRRRTTQSMPRVLACGSVGVLE